MNANPEPLALDGLLSDDERRAPFPNTARARCLKLLAALVGPGGLEAFLRTPQPDLDDRTGSDLLQNAPEALLARLEKLEGQTFTGGIDQ